MLATGSGDKAIRLWNLPDFEELSFSPLLGHSYYVNLLCVQYIWDYAGLLLHGREDYSLGYQERRIASGLVSSQQVHRQICCFSPDSQHLVTGATDNAICVFSIATKQLIRIIEMAHENYVSSLSFTPDNMHIVSGSGNGDLKVWQAQNVHANKAIYYIAECQDLGMSCLAISPTFGSAAPNTQTPGDKTYFLLATCGGDSRINLWDLNTAPKCNTNLRCVLSGHTANVMMVAFSPDGKLLASGAMDKLVKVWCPIVGNVLFTLESHSRYITSVAFSMDNVFLATGSADRTAMIWSLTGAAPGTATDTTPPLIDVDTEGNQPLTSPEGLVSSSSSSVGPKPLLTWSPDDVANWLQEIGLDQYADSFKEQLIDGEEIQNLTNESLSQDLGVKALGHRQKILRAVLVVKEQGFYVSGKPSDDSVPDEYLCPITRQIMTDPVIAADGFSYEEILSVRGWERVTTPVR
ncbi:putative WD repeat, SAM and U-box domain-containing protein 1 [Apostichopus japonicus]|uniref:WD repeat, SAM and U-box domain-containing protein 1 n=1 Tax=Stichopus japonicus TaxID=307972 RepID=A0A2G8KKJ5_STIJA|nr:putative WD repeat, SAM and U-box domain-containing protein 1 [Apostichopus japonicus]